MYYLVEIKIFKTFDATGSTEETILWLAEAKDKNQAWEKTKKFVEVEYLINRLNGVKIDINVKDTII